MTDKESLYSWIKDNIDPNVDLCKHKTKAGDYLGWKYFVTLPNTKRSEPIEVIEFTDGLCFMGFSAWVKPSIIKKILLTLKEELSYDR